MTLITPMPTPRLADLASLHFIAIGGAGMSGVAQGFLGLGAKVSGSDQQESAVLDQLRSAGATCWVGHDASHVGAVDAVVVSSAIPLDNVELVEARRLGIPVLHRSVALAALMQDQQVVSIAGTHGKTTTTAMTVSALRSAGLDPSFVIGAPMLADGLSAHIGSDNTFVIEADESDGSFLQYPTQVAVVTNVDPDHLDNWLTPQHYADGFEQFASAESVEVLIVDGADLGAARLADRLRAAGRRVLTYGIGSGFDLSAAIDGDGWQLTAGPELDSWSDRLSLAVPGSHNLRDALAAVVVGQVLGLDRSACLAGLAAFLGTARRFQSLGSAGGRRVVDDYAHHPTEVHQAIATGLASRGSGRLVVAFQPHLFSRTQIFADSFGAELAGADLVLVLDVYPAREAPIPGVSGQMVADAVRAHGGQVIYEASLSQAVSVLADEVKPGDLLMTVGAGSVTTLGPALLDRWRHNHGQ